MSRAIIAAALLAGALPASAQHTDATHAIAQFKQGDVAIRILVIGEVDGLGWANVDLAAPLFCQPVKLALSADQIVDIMEHMSVKLTDNQRALLEEASRREDRCFVLPSNLKGGAAQKVAAKLIGEGLAKEIKAKTGLPIWRRDGEGDQVYCLKLSAAGAKAIATSEERSGKPEPEAPAQESLRDSIDSPETSLHTADASKAPPRKGSKLASVMALISRAEGATILALIEATGWLPHTTRAAITGVRKRGYSVVLDRSAEGASVYRLSDLQESEAATSAPQTPKENKPARRQPEAKAKAAA